MGMGKQIKLETNRKQKWKWSVEAVIIPGSSALLHKERWRWCCCHSTAGMGDASPRLSQAFRHRARTWLVWFYQLGLNIQQWESWKPT